MGSHESYQKRRLLSSYLWVVISVFIVLFMLGLQGFILLNSKQVADYFREQIPMSIYFKEDAKEVEMRQLEKSLQMAEYTKKATYVSAAEAAEKTKTELGEDFLATLDGTNPLPHSIDVRLKAAFVTDGELEGIAQELASKDFVQDVQYDKPLVSLLNANVKRISLWMLVISGIFILIAFLLINSSIRLSIYAKRFTIKTMQMVGATKGFIRKPFILTSLRLGVIGALLALVALAGVVYWMDGLLPELEILKNYEMLGVLFAGVLVFGILINLLSTFFATRRYLNLKTDQLYY
jgi:cell division transport system permease protein